MSTETLEEKTSRPIDSQGRARATLAHLLGRLGYRELEKDKDGPKRVRICPMDVESIWTRVSGKGSGAVFEMEGT